MKNPAFWKRLGNCAQTGTPKIGQKISVAHLNGAKISVEESVSKQAHPKIGQIISVAHLNKAKISVEEIVPKQSHPKNRANNISCAKATFGKSIVNHLPTGVGHFQTAKLAG